MTEAHDPIDLRRTLKRVGVPSFIVARDATITWVNDAGAAVFGDLAGRSLSAVVAAEDLPLAREKLEQKLGGVPVTDYEVDVITRDGGRRRAEVSSVRIEGGDACKAVFGVVLVGAPRIDRFAVAHLTPRQSEVLDLLEQGASTQQIAAQLHLTTETVRNHVRNVLRALGAHSRLEAVAVARRRGLLGDG